MSRERYGSVIGVRPETAERYEALHRSVPAAVLATIADCHNENYSIFRHGDLLFAYFEYTGSDYSADMARMAADPATQAWWELCRPLQYRIGDRAPGQNWLRLPEVFHTD